MSEKCQTGEKSQGELRFRQFLVRIHRAEVGHNIQQILLRVGGHPPPENAEHFRNCSPSIEKS